MVTVNAVRIDSEFWLSICWRPNCSQPLVRQGETDPAARVGDHEIDHLGGDQLCRADQVSLVLPVLIIGHDDEFAVPEVVDGLFDGAEGHSSSVE
jgi:hypothetical protein